MRIVKEFNQALSEIMKSANEFQGKVVEISIQEYKEKRKRSLDANNYMWLLFDKIAKHPSIKSNKDEIYIHMLEKYGVFIYVPATEEQIADLRKVFRIVRERGECFLETRSGRELTCQTCQCYKGSSLYDIKEMAHLVDGVVSDAKELGIDTMTPTELEKMKSSWKG